MPTPKTPAKKPKPPGRKPRPMERCVRLQIMVTHAVNEWLSSQDPYGSAALAGKEILTKAHENKAK